jgi:FkbM family methyltransferase
VDTAPVMKGLDPVVNPDTVIAHPASLASLLSWRTTMNIHPHGDRVQLPRVSYAQNQEDILLDRLFGGRPGSFVDVGAHHPVFDSNTFYFYERGWRGTNVEPQPHLHRLLAQHRPGDLNLLLAVSDQGGTLPFYEVPDCDGLSTLSRALAEEHSRRGLPLREWRVAVRTLAEVIAEHQIAEPDFLSIDVEGHEDRVLRGAPLGNWRPRVIVVESTLPLSAAVSHHAWEPGLLSRGYLFATFNGINRFYLREDLREHLHLFQVPVNALDDFRQAETVFLENRVRELEARLREREARGL